MKKNILKLLEDDFNNELSKFPVLHPVRMAAKRYADAMGNLIDKLESEREILNYHAPVESRSDTDNEQAEKKCVHPREQRRYIGRGWLKCDLCGEEFQ